ncbi:hypothetical protein GCM10009545_40420 [Saccharopolyspora thermophila]|uniref:Uncharacterized protein n=1 Tax=Saccharopolyspora thermophila TaxID=89367 RepID=A0ABN1D4L9_9PSEU
MYGRSALSTADCRICCTRITLVTAAIVVDGPTRSAQISAARAMGSKGRGLRALMVFDASSGDPLG